MMEMTWLLIWLNVRVAILIATLQLLVLYRSILFEIVMDEARARWSKRHFILNKKKSYPNSSRDVL